MPACSSCKAPIYWARTVDGAAIPLAAFADGTPRRQFDGAVLATGRLVPDMRGGDCLEVKVQPIGAETLFDDPPGPTDVRYRPHWADCPHADRWRRRTRSRAATGRGRRR